MRLFWAVLLCPLSLGLAGCGADVKTVPVRGKLVAKGGAAFRVQRPDNTPLPPGDTGIRVKFSPAEGVPGEPTYAKINTEDSTFEVLGKNRAGIPPGRYVVTVFVGSAGGEKDSKPAVGTPRMEGKEVARQEVTVDGLTELTIEIDGKP